MRGHAPDCVLGHFPSKDSCVCESSSSHEQLTIRQDNTQYAAMNTVETIETPLAHIITLFLTWKHATASDTVMTSLTDISGEIRNEIYDIFLEKILGRITPVPRTCNLPIT